MEKILLPIFLLVLLLGVFCHPDCFPFLGHGSSFTAELEVSEEVPKEKLTRGSLVAAPSVKCQCTSV